MYWKYVYGNEKWKSDSVEETGKKVYKNRTNRNRNPKTQKSSENYKGRYEYNTAKMLQILTRKYTKIFKIRRWNWKLRFEK